MGLDFKNFNDETYNPNFLDTFFNTEQQDYNKD